MYAIKKVLRKGEEVLTLIANVKKLFNCRRTKVNLINTIKDMKSMKFKILCRATS